MHLNVLERCFIVIAVGMIGVGIFSMVNPRELTMGSGPAWRFPVGPTPSFHLSKNGSMIAGALSVGMGAGTIALICRFAKYTK